VPVGWVGSVVVGVAGSVGVVASGATTSLPVSAGTFTSSVDVGWFSSVGVMVFSTHPVRNSMQKNSARSLLDMFL